MENSRRSLKGDRMTITTRNTSKYVQVDFEHYGTKVDIGFLSYEEVLVLWAHLISTADDLWRMLPGETQESIKETE